MPPKSNLPLLAQSLYLLLELYHDLNSQDLPEYFEDCNAVFLGDGAGAQGLVGKYLRWEKEELMGDVSKSNFGLTWIATILQGICYIEHFLTYSPSLTC